MNNSYIHSIEFDEIYYQDQLEMWEIAKEILERKVVKQGVKEIQYTGKKFIFTSRPNFKGIYIPEEYYKGIIINYISK